MLIIEDPTKTTNVAEQYKRCSFTIICVQVLCLIVSHVHLHPYRFLLQAVPLL
jgi:hypothetical protein